MDKTDHFFFSLWVPRTGCNAEELLVIRRWLMASRRTSSLWGACGGPWIILSDVRRWAVIHSHLLSSVSIVPAIHRHLDGWIDGWKEGKHNPQTTANHRFADAQSFPSIKRKLFTHLRSGQAKVCRSTPWQEVTPPTPGDSQRTWTLETVPEQFSGTMMSEADASGPLLFEMDDWLLSRRLILVDVTATLGAKRQL